MENFDINTHPENGQIITKQLNELEKISVEEPSIWRTIGRLFSEAVFIFSYIGIHWIIKLWLIHTKQEEEWWAKYLLTISVYFAIIAFTVIFGCELVVNCKRAFKYTWKNLWN